MEETLFGELIVEENFEETIREISEKRVKLPDFAVEMSKDYGFLEFASDGGRFTLLDDALNKYILDPVNGSDYYKKTKIAAYDESIDKYSCLEGDLFVTAHSIVQLTETEYLPIGYVSADFYTKVRSITEESKCIHYAEDVHRESQIKYAKDKIHLMSEKVIDGSTLFIDGPIIAGDVYTYMIALLHKFVQRDIVPVFFVKNSNSDLVISNIKELKGCFNSDLHWASLFLKKGERSSFFKYTDVRNSNNSKVFCYCRLFDGSPQRVEFYSESFDKNIKYIDNILDCVYYMAILQGKDKNPQIRPVAIAEKYAREYIKLCDVKETFRKLSQTIPTVNEERFRR